MIMIMKMIMCVCDGTDDCPDISGDDDDIDNHDDHDENVSM